MSAKARFGPFSYVESWRGQLAESGWWHSFQLPGGRLIQGVNTLEGLKLRLAQFPIPSDLTGKRVLDIGAWDGWFSFELERRGAQVVAVDNWDNPRFHEVHEALQSRVEYLQMDIYELTPERIGQFDLVLFLGVLYHLKHPILALERVCALTKEMAAVDSFVLRDRHLPNSEVDRRSIMEFYETNEFGGQTDNWVGPSVPCLMAFCRTAGFARVELRNVLDHGACLACYRKWSPPAKPSEDAPKLLDAYHHTNFGINFSSVQDDYVVCGFDWAGRAISHWMMSSRRLAPMASGQFMLVAPEIFGKPASSSLLGSAQAGMTSVFGFAIAWQAIASWLRSTSLFAWNPWPYRAWRTATTGNPDKSTLTTEMRWRFGWPGFPVTPIATTSGFTWQKNVFP